MDKASYDQMKHNIDLYFPVTPMKVADLGSYDVSGNYRDIINSKWTYTGIDLLAGPNVDLVMAEEYRVPVKDDHFDALISGQCFEHVRNPFKLMKEVSRIVKPGGLVIVVVPLDQPEHRYPVDCWRILGDGWRSLFDESGIETIKTEYVTKYSSRKVRTNYTKKGRKRQDSWAIGRVK